MEAPTVLIQSISPKSDEAVIIASDKQESSSCFNEIPTTSLDLDRFICFRNLVKLITEGLQLKRPFPTCQRGFPI